MIEACGKAAWIKPKFMKFAGILSITRAAPAEKLASRPKYFSAAALIQRPLPPRNAEDS
jgi:hypothetical protein